MLKLISNNQITERDEGQVLEGFVNSPLLNDCSKSDRVKLAIYIASPAPLGLQCKISSDDFTKLLDLWNEGGAQRAKRFYEN